MADTAAALVAFLEANVNVHAVIEDRIYKGRLPEPRVLPAVTYQVVDKPELHVGNYVKPLIVLKCLSYTYALSWRVAQVIRNECQHYHGMMGTIHTYCLVDRCRDGKFEPLPEPGIYPVHVYVSITHRD